MLPETLHFFMDWFQEENVCFLYLSILISLPGNKYLILWEFLGLPTKRQSAILIVGSFEKSEINKESTLKNVLKYLILLRGNNYLI